MTCYSLLDYCMYSWRLRRQTATRTATRTWLDRVRDTRIDTCSTLEQPTIYLCTTIMANFDQTPKPTEFLQADLSSFGLPTAFGSHSGNHQARHDSPNFNRSGRGRGQSSGRGSRGRGGRSPHPHSLATSLDPSAKVSWFVLIYSTNTYSSCTLI